MTPKYLLASLLVFSTLWGEENTEAVKIGEKLSSQLVQKLGGELKAAMAAHGPLGALGFCSVNAIRLTNEVSDNSGGYTVKRVSLKERNLANRASAQEAALLQEWETLITSGQSLPAYTLKPAPKGQIYYKPLVIGNDVCLKCHGNVDGNSELGKAITAAYPKDKATGYKMGDLRGMIVVNIPNKIEN